jgi:sodium transport system permease protein
MKKELVRTFTDIRSIASLLAVPLILLLVMWLYSRNGATPATSSPASTSSSTTAASSNSFLAALLPMMILMMIASSVQVTVPNAIAGEKERKTLSAILMTPIKKWEYLLGKVLALVIIGFLSAIISFCIIAFALPALLGLSSVSYSFGQYIMLFLLTFLTVLFSTMVMVSWCLEAKSLREAMGDASIFAVVMMVVPFLTRNLDLSENWVTFAPLINISVAFTDVASGVAVDAGKMTLILLMTFVYSALFFANAVYDSRKEGVLA